MMQVTDRLVAPPRGTPAQAMAYAGRAGAGRLEEVRAYVAEVYRLAPLAGLDPAIAVAQSAHETDAWRSPVWRQRLNPAGLGVTDGPDYGYGFGTGVEAARAQLVHLAAYALGLPLPPALAPYAALDPRLRAIPIPWLGSIRTIADLVGKWATDVNYAAGICRQGNAIWPDLPDQEGRQQEEPMSEITFGRVPRPAWVDQYVEKPAGHGYGDYGPRRLRGIVLHRMVGTLLGTRTHFRAPSGHGLDALTDWGIGGALDGALDGTIDRYNDPDGRRSPWASGPAMDAQGRLLVNGDAVEWYQRYAVNDPAGVNIFNRDTEAIELSGMYDTPITEKQYQSVVALIAWRLDAKMRLPWHIWPKNHDGVQAILWHGEIMGWTKACPGQVVTGITDRLIADVRDRLRRYQEQAGPAPEPPVPAPQPSVRPEDDPEVLKSWFGRLRVGSRTLTYSPRAAENPASISAIWRRHGEATGEYPRIAGYVERDDGTRIYEFDGGWKVIDPAGPQQPRPAGEVAGP